MVALGFSEKDQVFAACTDALACQSTDTGQRVVKDGGCLRDGDCVGRWPGIWRCEARPDQAQRSSVPSLSTDKQLSYCFGNSAKTKAYNKYGIDALLRFTGNGRAPLYQALQTAYEFLRNQPLGRSTGGRQGNAKHIVLLTDGPDTCTQSDNFTFASISTPTGPGGQCRKECAFTTVRYQQLLAQLAQDGFPVHLHVIQIQSQMHLAPDATLQELACRSEGTYQFLNTASWSRGDSQSWLDAMALAVLKVRYALAGNWRVGIVDNAMASAPKGQMRAVRGALKFDNALFASLDSVFTGNIDAGWQFDSTGLGHDSRLPFRVACASSGDCGGEGDCGVNSCGPDGLCRQAPAPDLLSCGGTGSSVCCKGSCAAKCTSVCK